MIAALAGRRIDAPGARAERFPLENVPSVCERIRAVLSSGTRVLVCSASCGADLIALDEAGKLGIRRRVVLPFAREPFREMSVADRPGDWGPVFDGLMDQAETTCDIVVLPCDPTDADAYAAANAAILDEAERISREISEQVRAVVVWDGKSRGDDDLTAAFRDEAKRRGYPVTEISTL